MPNKKAKYRKMERRKKSLEIRKYKRMKKKKRRENDKARNIG
tara:strand:- start:411 stop:536 length:126 start_codon:yes stop_codon:yes gene_type:complete